MKKGVGKTVGKKKKKKLYDDEFKKFVVQEYMNSGNASEVSRKHDIARPTLLEWVKYYSNITTSSAAVSQACIQAIEKTSDAAVRSIEQATATRQEFLQQHYAGVSTLFSALITKMTKELSDDNKHPSLRDQAAALTALVNFVKEFTPTEEQGTTTINLLQQTVNNQ
jgi:transposase-like protein